MSQRVCRFWEQGNCRYGSSCKFYHPTSNGPTSSNRFSALQQPEPSNNSRRSNGYENSAPAKTPPYGLERAHIVADLSSERPQWILSAYGPGRQAPTQLFGGEPREKSMEEVRLMHYLARASGNPQQAIQEETNLFQASEQQIRTALNDVDGAMRFIISAESQHPNRVDICQLAASQPNSFGAPSTGSQLTSTFGAPSGGTGAFNQPSSLGQKPNPFATPTPAFGAPSQPATGGAFGQPSALGQKASPFGTPSQTFGAPSQLGQTNGFGQPSVLGPKPTPFGAPSSGIGANPFTAASGAPSAFTAPVPVANPFGQPSRPPNTGSFGAPSQPSVPFGTPSASPFGQPSTQANPFGQAPSQDQSNPFGQPQNPLVSPPTQQPNPFGPPSQTSTQNPFGTPKATPTTTSNGFSGPNMNPFSATPAAVPPTIIHGHSTTNLTHPPLASYATADPAGRLLTFKGQHVVYRSNEPGIKNQNGDWSKIWFPAGPPNLNNDSQMDDNEYNDAIKADYMHMRQTGTFQNGVMPMLPPKKEWCTWDF
ncbi:hypothetical protein BGZ60DRAFT_491381 [Tricladium varicosporioides]|nr:hypothetical protein BGZ60DRAFT_491381 [Hymenoscyphus varicosporioides]